MRNFFLFSLRGTFTFIQFILLQPNSPERKGGKIPPLRDGLQVWGGYLATAQRPVSKGGPEEKTLGWGDRASLKTPFHPEKNKENTNRTNPEKSQAGGFSPAQVNAFLLPASNSFTPPMTKSSPGFTRGPGALPCPGLTHTGWDSGLPHPSPVTHRSQTRWDLRSPRLTVGVSAAFAETFPGGGGVGRGKAHWVLTGVTWFWSLLGSEANGCLSSSANHCEAETFSLPRDRQTDWPCSLWFSVPDSLSLFLSQSLQVFKGETPPFFSSASSLRFCSSHCKSKNPNLSAHSFLLYCRGEGFNPLLTARALASPCAVCWENVPACFSNSSSKVLRCFLVLSWFYATLFDDATMSGV